ncbi:MAG: PorT family protein [Bacteroidales bacterium]|nr:PorT family protein [Bacteroidales bacterium]
MKIERSLVLFLVTVALILPVSVKSQRKVVLNMPAYDNEVLHFGFALALNQLFVSIKPAPDLGTRVFQGDEEIPDISPAPDYAKVLAVSCNYGLGFTVSIIGDLRLGNHFNLRFVPSFIYGSREIAYSLETYYMNFSTMEMDVKHEEIKKEVPSTYINFPLEFKFKAVRYNNFRPYLMAGAMYSLDLSSNAKKREQKNTDRIVKFGKSDFYLQGGVGFDFYNEWFKLGVELKMMYGLNDMLTRDGTIYTESIDKLNSKIFQLSLTFE